MLTERETATPGPFSFNRGPYLIEIADKFSDDTTETITICSGTQIGKTILQAITLGYEIDQDPGPSLFVMPNADLAKSFSETRLRPLFMGCPAIKRHIPMDRVGVRSSKVDWKKMEMHFDRMTLTLVGANSPANLASRPIRRLRLDEMDKFQGATEKEGDAPSLAKERTKTFRNRKIIQTSTPTLTTNHIWRAFNYGDRRYFMVPCPFCKEPQKLEWSNLKWPAECKIEDGEYDIERINREAWYECCHCKEKILDRHKPSMVRQGFWEPTSTNSTHASYQISSLYTLLGSMRFGDIAEKFFELSLKTFIQNWLGEAWEERGEVADEDAILKHRCEYEPGIIPEEPIAIVITADVQKSEIYYVVRAWGQHETSWLVEYGVLQTLEQLNELRYRQYHYLDKGEMVPVQATWGLIDSGYDTDRVYRFCETTGFTPVKGRDGAQMQYPAKFFGPVLTINTDFFKDALQVKLRMANDAPGGWTLHREARMDYAKHLASEAKVRTEADKWGRTKEKWKLVQGKDNHWLDCEIYQLAMAFHQGWRQEQTAPTRTIRQIHRDR